jgi:hypothetical protein
MLAGHDRQAHAARQAAYAAISLASSELRAMADWSGVTSGGTDVCATPGRFVDASLQPSAPWDGSAIDLRALTVKRQAESDAVHPSGVDPPVWRLFEYGPISRLVPSEGRPPPFYLVTWVSDGREGTIRLYATALGPSGASASLEASVGRQPDGSSLRTLTLRAAP